MCGQCGIILGKKRRTREELDNLGGMFTALLQYNERRGKDATGIFIAEKDGIGKILKATGGTNTRSRRNGGSTAT